LLEVIKDIGAFAGLAAFFGVAVLALLSFTQGRDIRRLRDWAGSAPERDAERKESTSAAAAERAEEMRRLEEARTEEREAAELRETRRERREAGLPELTRSERLRMSLSTEDRSPLTLVAVFLAVVVVAGGIAYAVTGGFGGDDSKNGGGGKHSSGLHPAEIEVAVLNGTAVEGLAGSYGDMVESRGFQLGNVTNTESAQELSAVMFKPNNGRAAQKVAKSLDIPRVQPMTEEVARLGEGAPVAVVVGEDSASAAG
jgi:LytR cell envelope-related transcriptional attenuator